MTINYSKQVLLKRGNTAVSSTYVGPLGEVTYDTDLYQLRVHDGERAGGWLVPGGPEYDLLLPLIGNAASQQDQINSLFANAAVQQTLIANLVNQGNADPGTDNETFWFNTEDGRLYIKWEDMWVDSSPTVLPSPGYITGIMEDFAGNIVPAANVTYSLGTQEAQWKDLWVSNNTIYIGNTPITVSNGSLLVNGNTVTGGSGDRLTNSSNEVVLDENGTLTVPGSVTFPVIFAARFDGEHYHGGADPFRGLTDAEWSTEVTIRVVNDSLVVFMDPISNANNPGYVNNDWFAFTEADHGIPGYTLSILFSSVLTNPVQIAVNQPPGYTATIKSANSIGLQAGTNVWQFGTDGSLTVPGGQLVTGEGGLAIQSTGEVLIAKTDGTNTTSYVGAGTNVTLATSKDGNGYYWNFTDDGNLILPSQLSIESLAPYYEGGMFEPPQGTVIQQTANTDLNLYSIGANARTVIGWLENTLNSELGGNVAEIQFNNYIGEVRITTGEYGNQVNGWQFRADGKLDLPDSGGDGVSIIQSGHNIEFSANGKNWNFATDGNLTLPTNGNINYANGRSILSGLGGGGAANTGNVQFDGNTLGIINENQFYTGFLNLQNNVNEVVLGSDTASTIRIGVYEDGNFNDWTFDSNGSLTFPNGNITIASNIGGSGTDAMLGSANAAVGIIAQGELGSVGVQWNDTGVDVGLGSNVAGVIVNSPAGSTPGTVQIVTGVIGSLNTWEFGADGNLTLPGNIRSTSGTGPVTITSNDGATDRTWTFGTAGNLTLPGKLWARASDNGSIAFTNNGVDEHGYLKVDAGYNMIVNAESNFSVKRAGTDRIAITDTTSDVKAVTDVRLVSNLAGSNKTWNFAASGIATLPSNSYLETTDINLKVGSQGTVTIRANAATVESTQSWTFGTNGATTFPGNISVPGNLSTIAGFAFYNGDPISIVATEPINSIRFIQPYHIEIAKTGLPAGFDTLLGSGTWTVTANSSTFTVVSVDSNGDYWRITVAENPNGTITRIATFNRAASGANIVIPSSGSINFANGVNILSNVATKVTGSWTVANGAPATYSFTVPGNATYTMWVRCNIANGIIIWNATVSLSNTNVPAIGTQYAWNYTDGGSPISLVTIPDQIRGTAGAISTDNTYAGITSNRFDFGISNTSGETQTVYWGYVAQ